MTRLTETENDGDGGNEDKLGRLCI